jgi:hypothetical protein
MDFLGTQICDHRVGNPVVAFILSTCPRCLGTGVYGSLGFDAHGKVTMVSKSSQLNQAIKKILKENIRTSGYGFNYDLIKDVINGGTTDAVKMEISRCMTYLMNAQAQAVSFGVQYDPTERLAGIQSLSAVQDSTEPRRINVSLVVITQANTTTQVNTSIAR